MEALPKSCFHLPMSADSFLVMSLQRHPGVYGFNAQMCVCICLLSELTLQRDMCFYDTAREVSLKQALQVLDSRSSWEKKHVHLFNSIPSCFYINHGIPCELRLSTLTWKGEWHNSGPSGHQSQTALSPFVWRGKGLLLNPSLSAYNSKGRENNQYHVSQPRLIDLAEHNEQNPFQPGKIHPHGEKRRQEGQKTCT